MASPFVTDDGWTVTFDRFLMVLGEVTLSPTSALPVCQIEAYQGFGYQRVIDLMAGGPQKVAEVFGLGMCDPTFQVAGQPESDSARGVGVQQADVDLLANQTVTPDWPPTCDGSPNTNLGSPSPAVGYVVGEASLGGVTKHFAWVIGSHTFESTIPEACGDPTGQGIPLEGGGSATVGVEVSGEQIFSISAPAFGSVLEFGLFAAADSDNDGNITMEELSLAQPPPQGVICQPKGEGVFGDYGAATLAAFLDADFPTTVGPVPGDSCVL
jgi:hypothetical protein